MSAETKPEGTSEETKLPTICQGCDNRVKPEDKGTINAESPCLSGHCPDKNGNCRHALINAPNS